MKYLYRSTFILILFLSSFSAKSQDFHVGGGIFYAVDTLLGPGIDIRGRYNWTETFQASLSVSYFFSQENTGTLPTFRSVEVSSRTSAISFKPEIHFFLDLRTFHNLEIYSLAGVNLLFITTDLEESPIVQGGDGTQFKFNFNFGGGVEYDIRQFYKPFGELKVSFGEQTYMAAIVGLKIPIY